MKCIRRSDSNVKSEKVVWIVVCASQIVNQAINTHTAEGLRNTSSSRSSDLKKLDVDWYAGDLIVTKDECGVPAADGISLRGSVWIVCLVFRLLSLWTNAVGAWIKCNSPPLSTKTLPNTVRDLCTNGNTIYLYCNLCVDNYNRIFYVW